MWKFCKCKISRKVYDCLLLARYGWRIALVSSLCYFHLYQKNKNKNKFSKHHFVSTCLVNRSIQLPPPFTSQKENLHSSCTLSHCPASEIFSSHIAQSLPVKLCDPSPISIAFYVWHLQCHWRSKFHWHHTPGSHFEASPTNCLIAFSCKAQLHIAGNRENSLKIT